MSAASPKALLPTLPTLPIVDPATGLPTASELAWRNSLQYRVGGLNNPSLNTYAPIDNPIFTGTVTGPTFSGAGTGLTGMAAALSIGGNAATATNATNATNLTGTTQTTSVTWVTTQYFSTSIVLPSAAGDGIKVNPAAPTFAWRNLIGNLSVKTTGATSPSWSTFQGNISGYAFTAGDVIDFFYKIGHDYVPGTDIYLTIHWTHNGTAISGNAVFTTAATFAKGYAQAIYPAEVTNTATYNTVNIATTPQYEHMITELKFSTPSGSASLLNTTNLEPDGLIKLHLTLTTAPTVTGGNLFIDQVDISFQSTGMGTKNRTPNFYT
jgi:hypothetical protein